jgi:hypothetical protein
VRPILALVALAVLSGTTGCGREGDRATARAVTDRFFAAFEAGDGAEACAQLSPDTRTELESREQSGCEEAITGLQLEGGAVTGVQVYVRNAKVELSNGQAAFLDEGDLGWRLSAAGCTPQRKPADRPYDCELED